MAQEKPENKQVSRLDELYAYGKKKGVLTSREVMEYLTEQEMEPEQLDRILETLDAYGISVVSDEADLPTPEEESSSSAEAAAADAAAAAAREVIDEARAAGAYKWVDADAMTKATSNDVVDWTFSSESLFSLEVSGLQSLTDQFIFNDLGSGASSLFIDKSFADLTLFNPVEVSSAEDIRGPALMLKFYANQYRPYKYYNNSSYYAGYRNRVPMIKISEMYLIIAEVAAEKGDEDAGRSAITEIISHRGIHDTDAYFLYVISQSAYIDKVILEYIKEFYGEGTAYYATRRMIHKSQVFMNIDPEWFNRMLSLTPYPYPTDELSYGRHQDL